MGVAAENSRNYTIEACNIGNDREGPYIYIFGVPVHYRIRKECCEPDDAGGEAPAQGKSTYIKVTNISDYAPTSRLKRATAGRVISWQMSLEVTQGLAGLTTEQKMFFTTCQY
jgi:hypothetical protein